VDVLRFGNVEVDARERTLRVDGREAAVGARAFNVLLELAANAGRVVGKNELLDRAWPGLIVEENNLQVQVSALRKVMGAAAIATVPGRGYRFTLAAPAVAPGGSESPSTAPPPGPPAPASPLLGRDDDLAALAQLLPVHRILSLVGPGGIGKTVLAAAATRLRSEGDDRAIAWVELAPVHDEGLVPVTVARSLGITVPESDAARSLVASLMPERLLVVLDNAEHLLDAVAALVQRIVASTANVSFLVTTQAALKVPGERVYRLAPLAVPESGTPLDEARAQGAVALFTARAQAVDRRFELDESNLPAVIAVCARLDGIALAIELAAARVALLGVEGLSRRLDERLRLLSAGARGAPTRQQTLRAALDWSFELLEAGEQALFRVLGTFRGGFSLDGAIAVGEVIGHDEWAVMDHLEALVHRSMVEVDAGDPPRYHLLESAREYALAALAGEPARLEAALRAHARATLSAAERGAADYWLQPDSRWRAVNGPEVDNVRSALDWAKAHDPDLAVSLVTASWPLFQASWLVPEYRRRSEAIEPLLHDGIRPQILASYWLHRSEALRAAQDDQRRAFAVQAAAIFRSIDDRAGLYRALCIAAQSPPFEESRGLLEQAQALERPEWPPLLRHYGARAEGVLLSREGRIEEGRAARERTLRLARAAGSERLIDAGLVTRADHALAEGKVEEAVHLGREQVRRRHLGKGPQSLWPLANLANALLQHGEVDEARGMLVAFLRESRNHDWDGFDCFSPVFALLAAREGRIEDAARLVGHADTAQARVGGVPETNEMHARQLALEACEAGLEPSKLARLLAEGRQLSREEASSITVGP
jgi:predicted ATPase